MSAKSRRKTTITYSNDVEGEQELDAADNTASPAQVQIVALAIGANTITAPTGATCCTIVKPTDNTASLTLKGVTGDTGVRLHNTDPDSVSVHSSTASFVLTSAAIVTVRLFWS